MNEWVREGVAVVGRRILLCLLLLISQSFSMNGLGFQIIFFVPQVLPTLSGSIQTSTGPLGGSSLQFYSDSARTQLTRSMTVSPDGSFLISDLNTGNYWAYATSADYSAAVIPLTLTDVGATITFNLTAQKGPDWLDNFEHGTNLGANLWGGYRWNPYVDNTGSTVSNSIISDVDVTNKQVLHLTYTLGNSGTVFAGTGMNLLEPKAAVDLRPYTALVMDVKGNGTTVNIGLDSAAYSSKGTDQFLYGVKTTSNWQTVTLRLKDFTQPSYRINTLDVKSILSQTNGLEFKNGNAVYGLSGDIYLDNIRFIREDIVSPDVLSASINHTTVYQGQVLLDLSITDNNQVDVTVTPTITAVFADLSSRNWTVSQFTSSRIQAQINVNAADPTGSVSVYINNLRDLSGNVRNALVATFNKVNQNVPVISSVSITPRYVALGKTLTVDIAVMATGGTDLDRTIHPVLTYRYADGFTSTASVSYNGADHLINSQVIVAHEGRVTVDVTGITSLASVTIDQQAIATADIDFTSPILAWNLQAITTVYHYPLYVSSNELISITVSGGVAVIQSSPNMIHDLFVTLNSGANTLNLLATDRAGNISSLQGVINVVAQQSTVSVGGTTQSIMVDIPIGAVDQLVTITANITTQTYTVPVAAALNGQVIELRLVSSTGNIIPTAQFSVPVLLKLPFNGTITQGVAVAYLDTRVSPSAWRYDGVNVVSVDTVAHQVWVEVRHFTIFGVFVFADTTAPVVALTQADGSYISNGSFVGTLPVFTVRLEDKQPSDSGIVSYNLSLTQVVGGTYSQSTSNTLVATAQVDIVWDLSGLSALVDGTYKLSISAEDASGQVTTRSITLIRRSDALIANFLAGPNPVNINQTSVHLTYNLSKSMATTIRIFDVAGRKVRQIQGVSGVNGGIIGQNDIVWNGRTDQGDLIPAGLYLVYVTSDEGGLASAKRFMLLVTK